MENKSFAETHELLKTARIWMDYHRDEDWQEKCISSECKEIMKFLSQEKYKDVTDEETAELIVINFPDLMDQLTADRLRFERMVRKEAEEITEAVVSSLKPIERNRFLENVMSLLLSVVVIVLAIFVVIHVYNDNYDQATFNLVLGFISLFFLDIYNR